MGLGKIIQVIALCSVLVREHAAYPILIVVPHSMVLNWRFEFQKWLPSCRVSVLDGAKAHRDVQKKYILNMTSKSGLNCHVIVTSYNTAVEELSYLSRYSWKLLIVDEGQELRAIKISLTTVCSS